MTIDTRASLSRHALLIELENIERAIARSGKCDLVTDGAGRTWAWTSRNSAALVERQQLIVNELRRR